MSTFAVTCTPNTIEGYFSIMKRGITGVYHHVSPQHLKRYLAEYDFRYNERAALDVTDAQRATKAVAGVVGKRMTYQQPLSERTKFRSRLHGPRGPYQPRDPRQLSFSFPDDED